MNERGKGNADDADSTDLFYKKSACIRSIRFISVLQTKKLKNLITCYSIISEMYLQKVVRCYRS